MLRRWLHQVEGFTSLDERMAAALLGREHPLVAALSRTRVVGRQAIASLTVLPVAAATVLLDLAAGPVLLLVTAGVGVVFLGLWSSARRALRDRTHELIARGEGTVLPLIAREQQRLASRHERERLARGLEHALEDAWSWTRFPQGLRPLPGVGCLREADREARKVIAGLRASQARVQGVALVARLLVDGERSPLYAGDPRALRDELGRIAYLLAANPHDSEAAERVRAAA